MRTCTELHLLSLSHICLGAIDGMLAHPLLIYQPVPVLNKLAAAHNGRGNQKTRVVHTCLSDGWENLR